MLVTRFLAFIRLQKNHSAAVDAGDMLSVFYTNLHFHQTVFGLCGNACLIETIDRLAQKVNGIRSYANAFPEALLFPSHNIRQKR